MIYGEENPPPEWAYHSFNVFIILTLFLSEIFNFKPSTAMCLAGSFFGFIIMYSVPVYIHLKCRHVQKKKDEEQSVLAPSEEALSIASIVADRESKVPLKATNILYMILVVQGAVTLIGVIIYLALEKA